MDVAVLVGMVVLVLVPAGFVVMVAAVHLPLPVCGRAVILLLPGGNRNGGGGAMGGTNN